MKEPLTIKPEDTKIELTCHTMKSIIVYLEEKYGRDKAVDFIHNTGMPIEYVEDGNNWISFDYYKRLLKKLIEYTGDENSPYIAGTYAARRKCYGALQSFCLRIANPRLVYKMFVENIGRVAKNSRWELLKLTRNKAIIKFSLLSGFEQDENNCKNIQGQLSSIPTFWNLPLARIKESQCAAKGGDSCVYHIYWVNRQTHQYALAGCLIGMMIAAGLSFFLKALQPGLNYILLWSVLLISGFFIGNIIDHKILIKETIVNKEEQSKDLLESIETIEKLNIDLQNKVEERTQELRLSNKKLQRTLDELKKSQNQLVQSEKMATVGRLAAGMAHELNNPVGAVRNYLQDILEDTSQEDTRWERLKLAEKATDRCKKIVSELLTFARENKELNLVDINEIIDITISNVMENISNPEVRISKEIEPNLPKIRIDSMQMQQVFMNIVMNASEAIEEKGQITIKTFTSSEDIIVEISDTGKGIPEEIQSKIFDPFFTTKPPGKGMGLGLAISYNIIKRFNGNIDVRSKKNKGATFIITLPINM